MRLKPMFTESSLRQHPAVIKAFTGLPAAAFWDLIEKIKEHLPAYEAQRLGRADRQRALGGGRDFDQPLVLRVAVVLTYLRLHIPPRGGRPALRDHAGGGVARIAPRAARAPARATLPGSLGAE